MRAACVASGAILCAIAASGCGSARTAPLPAELQWDLSTVAEADDVPRTAVAPAVDAGSEPPAAPPVPLSPTVRISVRSTPRALVSWGRKQLGVTPLTVERPRDSGPMDLVLRADRYLTLHTRAYTFRNDSLNVEMIPASQIDTVLGARKALPDGGAPDAGMP